MRRIIAFLLVLVTLTVIIPTSMSLAAQHTHTWKKMAEQINSYKNKTATSHTENVIEYYKCTKCTATTTKRIDRTVSHSNTVIDRSFPTFSFEDGDDYGHTKFQKEWRKCTKCGYQRTVTVSTYMQHQPVETIHRDSYGNPDGITRDCICGWSKFIPYAP